MSQPVDPYHRLPHRPPFALIDRVEEVSAERGVCCKLVTAGDPCLLPDGTLAPVFVLEALAQAGAAYLNALGSPETPAGFLAQVERFVHSRPVRVGECLRLEVRVVRRFRSATMLEGTARNDDGVCGEARFALSTAT